jgi:hypothetical protein
MTKEQAVAGWPDWLAAPGTVGARRTAPWRSYVGRLGAQEPALGAGCRLLGVGR